jgi:hypothetical protein
MADVSTKLLAQFVANLERDVLAQPAVDLVAAESGEASPEAAPAAAVDDPALGAPPTSNGALEGEEGIAVRTIASPEAQPVDLLEMGGTPVLRRLLPLALGALVVVWVLRRRRRSARRG